MTTQKTARGKGRDNKLKLKKETLKDLDAKGQALKVKGGAAMPDPPATPLCPTIPCPLPPLTHCPLWTCAAK